MNTNNKQVAHLWANRSEESGKGSHFFFNNKTIYSYGSHFPIARHAETKDGKPCVLFTTRGYSNTTSRHISITRSAIPSGLPIFYVEDPTAPDAIADPEVASASHKDAEAAAAQAAKERNAEAIKARRLAKKNLPLVVAEWRAGIRAEIPGSGALPILLRLTHEGARIQTSRGAEINTAVAKRAWPKIKADIINLSKGISPLVDNVDFGNFKGATFRNATGGATMTVGCHDIPVDEVISIAKELKLDGSLTFLHAEVV
jgi:hypothetical protein